MPLTISVSGQYRPFDTLGQIGDNVRQVLIARANSDGPRSDEKDATNDLLLALQDRCPDAYRRRVAISQSRNFARTDKAISKRDRGIFSGSQSEQYGPSRSSGLRTHYGIPRESCKRIDASPNQAIWSPMYCLRQKASYVNRELLCRVSCKSRRLGHITCNCIHGRIACLNVCYA
jgi:hypothetical protein